MALGSDVIQPASRDRSLFEGDKAKLIELAVAGRVERSPIGEKPPSRSRLRDFEGRSNAGLFRASKSPPVVLPA